MYHIGDMVDRKRRKYGYFIGQRNVNPILNSCDYVVNYPDVTEETLAYAKLVDNIYNHIGKYGNQLIIYSITLGYLNRRVSVNNINQLYEKNGQFYNINNVTGWDL